MIIYCGISHLYYNFYPEGCIDKPIAFAYEGKVLDYSPVAKALGMRINMPTRYLKQKHPQVKLVDIDLEHYYKCSRDLVSFCHGWTDHIEMESPHAWYCDIPDILVEPFGTEFLTYLAKTNLTGIWAAAPSKLVAKIYAHFKPQTIVAHTQSKSILADLSLDWLKIPETAQLNKLGIYTIGELASIPKKVLVEHFGKRAEVLIKLAQGEDLNPFTTQKSTNITWKTDFITNPAILTAISRPQVERYLELGLTTIAEHLQLAKLEVNKLAISWQVAGETTQVQKNLKSSTQRKNSLLRVLTPLLPDYPIEGLKITCLEFIPHVPVQLDIFGGNSISQKIDSVKSQLGSALTTIVIPRRELVLEMWESSYL